MLPCGRELYFVVADLNGFKDTVRYKHSAKGNDDFVVYLRCTGFLLTSMPPSTALRPLMTRRLSDHPNTMS